jgi:hypothetical protein
MKTIAIAGAFAVATMALGADLAAAGARKFVADLVRVQEFVRADARGQATLQLSGDGRELRYELTVENLESFTQAHIHMAPDALRRQSVLDRFGEPSPKSELGPIVVYLTDFIRAGVTVNGVLATGVITRSDLVGPLKGYPLSLLAELMERKDTYIALHVIQSTPPNNEFCCPVGLRGIIEPARSQ